VVKNVYLVQEGEEKSHESKLYTTEKTYEELLDLANDLRTGSPKHDDHVIAVWIKVNIRPVLGIRIRRIRMYLGLPDPLVRGMDPDPDPALDPDPSVIMQK
jgi:hypothetical protein